MHIPTPKTGGILIPLLLLVCPLPGAAQSRQDATDAGPAQFRAETNVVSLRVSVTDRMNRPLVGLTKDDFTVYEDKIQQEINGFSVDDSPLAVALVLDTSRSMREDHKMERARAAALHFVKTSHQEDVVFLVDFNSKAAVSMDFTSDRNRLRAVLAVGEAKGRTALFDAVYLALEKLHEYETTRRKVMLLITDGRDTHSRHSSRDVERLAREFNIQIYAVGICGRDLMPLDQDTLADFAEVSGGRAFFTFDSRQLVAICNGISLELHRQYSLAYQPKNTDWNGKWRKLKVKVKRRKGWPRLVVQARKGYFARPQP